MNFLIKCGIAKIPKEQFETMDHKDYLRFKKNKYEYDVLVEDRISFKNKYKVEVMDKPRIEDIMIMYVKGEE